MRSDACRCSRAEPAVTFGPTHTPNPWPHAEPAVAHLTPPVC
jgi:hypothetical protein